MILCFLALMHSSQPLTRPEPVRSFAPAAAGEKVAEGRMRGRIGDGLPVLHEVHRATLPNGLQIFVKERRETQAIEVRVVVKVGHRYERPRDSGISHLLEHLLFKGTERQSEAELKWAVERRGGARNGITTPEATYYYVNIRDAHFDFAVDWLEDIVLHSRLSEEHLKQARKDVYSEQGGHYPRILDRILLTGFFQPPEVRAAVSAFPHANVAERVISELDHVDGATLKRHFEEYYVPNNMAVIVAGNVDAAEAVRKITARFGSLARRPVQRDEYIPYRPPRIASEVRTRLYPPVGQMTDVRYGLWTRGKQDPDRPALRLLARHLDRRLKEEIRYKRAMAYSVGSAFVESIDIGVLYAYADVPRGDEDEGKELIRGLFREVATTSMTSLQLADAREAIVGSSVRYYESNSRLADLYQDFFLTGMLRDEFAEISAVSAEDVLRVARRRLQPQSMTFVVARPPLTYVGAAVAATATLILIALLVTWRVRSRR